ncbi:MAG: hypothetical protein OEU92_20380 [Alphaproteobacteria bacterium]|nr:hypothetical protein [Alphaproteobacteria bacterium]
MPNALKAVKGLKDGLHDVVRVFWERCLAVIAWMSTAMLAVVVLGAMAPANDEPNLGILGKKAAYLRDAHHRYNVLFIGTSKTYRGVDPVLLQSISASHGCDVRAFNFGVSKLRLTELRHLADQLSPTMLDDYDLIVMSPMALSGIAKANWASNRIQHFNDWEGYWVSLDDIWHAPMSDTKGFLKKLYFSAQLTGSFAYRQLGIGRLAPALGGRDPSTADNHSGDLFDGAAIVDFSRHGYVALDHEPHDQFLRRGETIQKNPDHFERLKSDIPPVDNFLGPTAERAWKRFTWAMDHLADFDVPVALFLPPMLPHAAQDQALAETAEARGMPVLNYNQLDRYPELFDREHWFDYYHVAHSGAEILTRLLAQDICPLIETAKG